MKVDSSRWQVFSEGRAAYECHIISFESLVKFMCLVKSISSFDLEKVSVEIEFILEIEFYT